MPFSGWGTKLTCQPQHVGHCDLLIRDEALSSFLPAAVIRFSLLENGRGDRIRTCDLFTPSEARYQAALRPDVPNGGRVLPENEELASA